MKTFSSYLLLLLWRFIAFSALDSENTLFRCSHCLISCYANTGTSLHVMTRIIVPSDCKEDNISTAEQKFWCSASLSLQLQKFSHSAIWSNGRVLISPHVKICLHDQCHWKTKFIKPNTFITVFEHWFCVSPQCKPLTTYSALARNVKSLETVITCFWALTDA